MGRGRVKVGCMAEMGMSRMRDPIHRELTHHVVRADLSQRWTLPAMAACWMILRSGVAAWLRGEPPSRDLPRFLRIVATACTRPGDYCEWPAGGPRELSRPTWAGARARWWKSRGRIHAGRNRRSAMRVVPGSSDRRGALEARAAGQAEPAFRLGTGHVAAGGRRPTVCHSLRHVRKRCVGDAVSDHLFRTDGTPLWRAEKDVWATEASTPLIVGDTLYVARTIRSERCSRRSINGPAL